MTENSYNGVSLRLVGVIKYHKSKKGVWGSFLPWNDIWWLFWSEVRIFVATFPVAWDNSRHFGTPQQVGYVRKDVWERAQKFHNDDVSLLRSE